jgi:hypothetical protein
LIFWKGIPCMTVIRYPTLILPLLTGFILIIVIGLIKPGPAQANETAAVEPGGPGGIAFTEVLSSTASFSNKVETVGSEVVSSYIKGLYMTYNAAGHDGLRDHALELIDTTELNALVLDVKGDKGLLTYHSDVTTATAIGANNAPIIKDWRAFMKDLKDREIYTIARIVVFKDNYLARANPQWAVRTGTGELWLDREELPWLEPFHEGVWDYNIALAVEAAQRGFDEIQFDYVRFPTDGKLSNIVYSRSIEEQAVRTAAISGFLARAGAALEPYEVKLAADVFGYTAWHRGDFRIGQDLSDMAAHIDVLSPMLYPSTYDHGLEGLPQYDFAVAFPYEIVYESMIRAMSRVKATNPDIVVRPWIQDFPDYGFDRRTYSPDEIREQMYAAYDSGGGGWMLWDPRVRYTPEALVSDTVLHPANELGDIIVLRYENFADSDRGLQRSATSFRQDLERLWAAGYYPLNLRDLVKGKAKYKLDIELLAQNGWQPFRSDQLLNGRYYYVPMGKRPVVLTFDGSHISQYRILSDGRLDPDSAMGVLKAFHDEHPADWPLRATFFVQPEATELEFRLFGQPELAEQKLQSLVDWGMEIGSYTLSASDLARSDYEEVRRQLSSEAQLEAFVPGYEVSSLAIPQGRRPSFETLLRRGVYEGLIYDYEAVAVTGGQPIPSPRAEDFDPYAITRIQATADAVPTWLAFYDDRPGAHFVASGAIPDTKPVR